MIFSAKVICLQLELEPVRAGGIHGWEHPPTRTKGVCQGSIHGNQSNPDLLPAVSRRRVDVTAVRGRASSKASPELRGKLEDGDGATLPPGLTGDDP